MGRGQIAKNEVERKIVLGFGDDFVGIDDKRRIIVWADDGGTKAQIAISLTAPKELFQPTVKFTPAEPEPEKPTGQGMTPPWEEDANGEGWDFGDHAPTPPKEPQTVAETNELTEEEKNLIAVLAARLGL